MPPALVLPGPWPKGEAVAQAISGISQERAGRALHLGFDTEGDPTALPALLDVLDAHQVKSTFFVQGRWVEDNPDLLLEIIARGHELASHAFEHDPLGEASDDRIIDELSRTESLVVELAGASTRPYFRPPFGDRTTRSVQVAADAGWTTIIWTGGANDFVAESDVDSMCADLVYHTRPGSIVFAHTFNPDIPAVIDRYIRQVHSDGLVLVPLSVLLADDPEQYLVPNAEE